MSAGLDGGVCVEMSGVDEMCGGFDNKAVSIHWLQSPAPLTTHIFTLYIILSTSIAKLISKYLSKTDRLYT